MGGVDEFDQLISLYRVAIHGKKRWWVLITYMLDMAIANAWSLHVMSHTDNMEQLMFRRSIARCKLRQKTQYRARPSSTSVPGLTQELPFCTTIIPFWSLFWDK